MTVEEMKKKKMELGFSCEQISDRSGVPLGTVQKIFSGITKRPRYDTICQLEKAFPIEHVIFTDSHERDYKESGNMASSEYMKNSASNLYSDMIKKVHRLITFTEMEQTMRMISGNISTGKSRANIL